MNFPNPENNIFNQPLNKVNIEAINKKRREEILEKELAQKVNLSEVRKDTKPLNINEAIENTLNRIVEQINENPEA